MQYWMLPERSEQLSGFTGGVKESYTYFQKKYEGIVVSEVLNSTGVRFFTADISTKQSLKYGLTTYRAFSPDLIPMVQDERWIDYYLQPKRQVPHPFV